MSRGYTKISLVNIVIIALLVAAIGVGSYFIVKDLKKDGKRFPLAAADYTVAGDTELFGVDLDVADAILRAEFSLTDANKTGFSYKYVYTNLPEKCFRYNSFYAVVSGENISEVVIVIGDTVHRISGITKAENEVSFSVKDWGESPSVCIFIDTYAADLTPNVSEDVKVFTLHEMGFIK